MYASKPGLLSCKQKLTICLEVLVRKIGTDHGRLLSNTKGANCLLVDSQSYLDVILSIRNWTSQLTGSL